MDGVRCGVHTCATSVVGFTMAVKMITKIILETTLICNRTNKKLQGKLNSFRVGNGNFGIWKLFEGLVIFEQKKKTIQTGKKKRCIRHHRIFFLHFQTVYRALRSISVAGAAWKTTGADATYSITEEGAS